VATEAVAEVMKLKPLAYAGLLWSLLIHVNGLPSVIGDHERHQHVLEGVDVVLQREDSLAPWTVLSLLSLLVQPLLQIPYGFPHLVRWQRCPASALMVKFGIFR
jgi:hypothetical protein